MLTQEPRAIGPIFKQLVRISLLAGAAFIALIFCALMVLRFWVWPSMPQRQASIVAALEPQLTKHGLSLKMGEIKADWANWVTPQLSLDGLELLAADGQRVLAVKELRASIGLKSLAMLWRWQPVFSEISLSDPFVFAQRQSNGVFSVAGVALGADSTQDPALVNWLLRQGRIRMDGGELIWRDQLRGKSARLSSVTFAINNLGYKHAWALKATPPTSLGEPFVLQGDFSHGFFGAPSEFRDWSGQAFIQFDRVNFSELFGFVHLPSNLAMQAASGQGAMRAWLDLRKGALEDLTLDLDVSEARFNWGRSKRPMAFQEFRGRIQAQITESRSKLALKDIRLTSAQLSQPVQIPEAQLVIDQAKGSDAVAGQLSAASLDLNAGMWLIEHLPLTAEFRRSIVQFSPRGTLEKLKLSWRESADRINGFSLETGFSSLSVVAGPKRPGFSGLSGRIKATEAAGEIMLESAKGTLIFPGLFREPSLGFESLAAELSFTAKNLLAENAPTAPPALNVSVKKIAIENSDLKADFSGSYQWGGKGAGRADLQSRIHRARPESIARYVPLSVGQDTRDWLRDALMPGKPFTGSVELAGDLDQFPFRDPLSGKFLVRAKAQDASLKPAPGWPVIKNINADVEFERSQFRLLAKNAKLNELSSSEIKVRIDDLEEERVILYVDGSLSGDLQRLIDAANQSPLRQTLAESIGQATGRGASRLGLSMAIDLSDTDRSRVTGSLGLSKASLKIFPALAEATGVNAEIGFDREGVRAIKAQGQMVGGPISVNGQRSGKNLLLAIDGQASASGLESWIEQALGYESKSALAGSARYTAQIELRPEGNRMQLQSSLAGLASDLPAPFKKTAAQDWGLRVEMTGADSKTGAQRWVISSNQQRLNARINIAAGRNKETTIDLDSAAIAGQLSWQPAREVRQAAGRATASSIPVLRARLSRLHLEPSRSQQANIAPEPTDAAAQEWPTVDAVVEDFRVGERQWGRLEVQASPVAATRSWEILKFSVANPDATLTGQGQWAMVSGATKGSRRSRTSMNIELDIKNGASLLARSGYPNLVRATPGKIQGSLNWPGSPIQFSGSALSGQITLNLEQGQFLKSEPGLARLVGVLNLQSLPRRIKLDFRDVFSEGFTYERIRGDIQFTNGQASTQNFRIVGIQASVILEGRADIGQETQDLRVLVLPELNAGLASLGYAALVNPAIGLGTFIAQYILRNPVREFLSYEYKVTGPWADPVVESVKREMKSEPQEMRAPSK